MWKADDPFICRWRKCIYFDMGRLKIIQPCISIYWFECISLRIFYCSWKWCYLCVDFFSTFLDTCCFYSSLILPKFIGVSGVWLTMPWQKLRLSIFIAIYLYQTYGKELKNHSFRNRRIFLIAQRVQIFNKLYPFHSLITT